MWRVDSFFLRGYTVPVSEQEKMKYKTVSFGHYSTKDGNMIDIHTHILPGLDDGAGDIYDSIEMAELAFETGTEVIVATPHCNIPGLYTNYFGKEYCSTYQRTKEILSEEVPGLTLLAGMEVFTTEEVPRLLMEGKIFPINRTRYVLMEFDFGEDPDFAVEILQQVKEIRALPVIAHAERYEFVQDDPSIAYEWKRKGYEIQVNKGSFIGRFGERAQRTAYKLLDHNLITAVASDAHSPVQRTTCMSDAYEYLSKSYPKDYLEALFTDNPRYICNGLRPIQFQRIPFKRTHR